jgi:two-component system, chemotaxis family, CheB/CheR fusion protein
MLSLRGGVVEAGEPGPDALDRFLKCLAADRKEHAVAVVLGEGVDATSGLIDVLTNGGAVLLADGQSDDADRALHGELCRRFESLCGRDREPGWVSASEPAARIVSIMQEQRGFDLSRYKRGVVARRIQDRMRALSLISLSDYSDVLRWDPVEVDLLFHNLLIGVTSFFRDRLAFSTLEERVLPELLRRSSTGRPIRIWVPACATGEEAYSIAIVLREAVEREGRPVDFFIIGTDLDPHAIAFARRGRYSSRIVDDVTEERLARFFSVEGQSWRVNDDIRESVRFSLHDLLADPPFLDVDLVSCRNLLIYLDPVQQRRVTAMLHRSLTRGGFLLLSPSEMVGDSAARFEVEDRNARIYRKVDR